ncbi:MAG: porin [Myxococcales bacterium]|nr:porin [Myxococcales bacterium]
MRAVFRRDGQFIRIANRRAAARALVHGPPFTTLCASIIVAGVVLGSTAHAADLEQIVEEQALRIDQLETTQRRLYQQLVDTEDAPPAVSTAPADEPSQPIDREYLAEYVDQRIEDFEGSPVTRFLISGYGTVGLVDVQDGMTAFSTRFNPGFHFRMADSLHFVAELEIELEAEDGELETHIGLEFAQVDYLPTDWLVVSGGKFLTPFNTFGPRLHPTWINKLASPPPIYGSHGSGGFIPVLANIGAMASGGRALWNDDAKVNYAFYVGNGVTGEDLSDPPDEDELLDLEFNNTADLDDGVTLGGRVGFLPIGNFELGVSYMTGDPSNARYHLVGVDAWYRFNDLELRGEFAHLARKESGVEADVSGYWLQAAYRLRSLLPGSNGFSGVFGRLEPVIRWGEIEGFPEKNREQLAIGLNYWLFESAPLKLTYEINDGAPDDNRFILSFAYGF